MKPRDKQLLANAPYANATIPEPYQRHIVGYHRQGAAGHDRRRYRRALPLLRAAGGQGDPLRGDRRRGCADLVGRRQGRAARRNGRPGFRPEDILQRIEGLPKFVEGGPKNPLGARGLYLFDGSKDTLFRIHGTNQPELIGEAISSGCIRMTNEDVIELYDKVKIGTPVVVLGPKNGDSPTNPRVALTSMRD